MEKDIVIRVATPDDAQGILAVYKPYIEKTAITFEYDVPSVENFRGRIEKTLSFFPYLVAESDGVIIGYAYASSYHPRAAFKWAVELSIYLDMDQRGHGLGKRMYSLLEEILKKQNIINLYASIAYIGKPDDHLTDASVKFHSAMGYEEIGRFTNSGYKFDTWYSTVWMAKYLSEHTSFPPEPVPFEQVRQHFGL